MPRRNEPPERTCAVTRAQKPVDELIRFVVAPDGTLAPDLRRRLPGRGVWVTATRETVATAEKKRVFEKAFDGKVTVPPGLADRVDALLAAAATGALSLARKAGTLVGGFTKVEAALGRESVVAVIHAAEAAPDGVAKLESAARRRFGASPPPVVRTFTAGQLDLAFGGTNVIHAALLAGPASDHCLARVGDLDRYRGTSGASPAAGDRSFDASTELNDPVRTDARNTLSTHV